MDRRVKESQERARKMGLRVILGRPETPPPNEGWGAHLAPTVDIIPTAEGPTDVRLLAQGRRNKP